MLDVRLYDRNGQFVRRVSRREAAQLVDSEAAEPLTLGGWRGRPDVEWAGIRLIVRRDCRWSPAALTSDDMRAIAGEFGDTPSAAMSRLKLKVWQSIH